MQNIISILKQVKDFEMLGLDIGFQVNKKQNYLTYPGFIFTCVLMTFMLLSFIQMIRDIQEGANPVTQKTSQLLQQNEGFSFPAQTFIVVTYVGDQYNQPIVNTKEKTYYTLVFQKLFYDTQQTTNYFFEKCNNKTFNFIQSARANLPRDAMQCLSSDIFEKDKIMRIENSFSLKNMTAFQISIHKCANSTTDYVCASKEEIDARLNNSQIVTSFPFYEFNSLNFNNPYELKVGTRQMTFTSSYYKKTQILLKYSQTYTEQNIFYFFPYQRVDDGIEYFESIYDFYEGNELGSVVIQLSDMKYVYHRSYQNILNVFGSLGGTFSVIRIIFMLLLNPLQKLSFSLTMFNKISGKQKQLNLINYFRDKKQREAIENYYNIIQQAIELESYMEMMLKYENDQLTFRSEKLVQSHAGLLKSQGLSGLPNTRQIEQLKSVEEEISVIQKKQQNSPKSVSYNSSEYIVNNER